MEVNRNTVVQFKTWEEKFSAMGLGDSKDELICKLEIIKMDFEELKKIKNNQILESYEVINQLMKAVLYYANKDNWCSYHPDKYRYEINPDDCSKVGRIKCGGKLARQTIKEIGLE